MPTNYFLNGAKTLSRRTRENNVSKGLMQSKNNLNGKIIPKKNYFLDF